PVMDGMEAARSIREMGRPDGSAVPIFAMTANAYEEDKKMSREAGMNEHLSKPIDTGLLYRTIRDYMERSGTIGHDLGGYTTDMTGFKEKEKHDEPE
ncbi:MAG: response regulator, partial [Clostridium sp.]|nr:response regulator [Clostridium sp.]